MEKIRVIQALLELMIKAIELAGKIWDTMPQWPFL